MELKKEKICLTLYSYRSTILRRFETGNCPLVTGLSGVELAQRVIWEHDEQRELPKPIFSLDRSPEYWLGFYLSYYQWYNNLKFEQITSKVTIRDILLMYRKYHEMDVMHFVVALDEMRQERQVARLQEYRKRICLSQRELAEKADVPLRTIQQYEQKQKNINHARVDYVIRLAQALYCRPDDLMEL